MGLKYAQKANGLYTLSRNDIEQIATTNLQRYYPMNLEYPQPLNAVEYLEECLGLKVKYARLGLPQQGILGATVMCDTAELIECDPFGQPRVVEETYGTVIISSNLRGVKDLPRRNYTLLHEGGHNQLHREYFDNLSKSPAGVAHRHCGYIACRKVERYRGRTLTDGEWMEWQADTFAAAMLMPKNVFYDYTRTRIRHTGTTSGYLVEGRSKDQRAFREIILDVCSAFRVSQRAAQIRMIHLGLIRPISV